MALASIQDVIEKNGGSDASMDQAQILELFQNLDPEIAGNWTREAVQKLTQQVVAQPDGKYRLVDVINAIFNDNGPEGTPEALDPESTHPEPTGRETAEAPEGAEVVEATAAPEALAAPTDPIVEYIRSRGVTELAAVDRAYLKDNGVSELLDGLLKHLLVTKPMDTRQFSADFFAGKLEPPKRLVLLASNVGHAETLKAAVRSVEAAGAESVVAAWDFEGEPAALTTTVQELVKTHGTFKTVAMVCHGGGSGGDFDSQALLAAKWEAAGSPKLESGEPNYKDMVAEVESEVAEIGGLRKVWKLTKSAGVDLTTGVADGGVDEAIKAIAEAASLRVDLLSCSLAATPEGCKWLQQMEKETSTNFAASTTVTGRPEQGAHWVLETDEMDVATVYFDAEKIEAWQGSLS